MELIKDRTLVEGQKVRVYVNLNRQGFFSIQDYRTGLVCAYASSVSLKNCSFVVRKAAQTKTRKERVRSVHAFLVGYFMEGNSKRPPEMTRKGYYDPYVCDTLIDEETNQPIGALEYAYCSNKRVYFAEEVSVCKTLFD
ncbi:hypothetical protein [Aneurinibacillus tyrosinisolvens]|uniref:hypothetical protein n=1 Tax=Aneurinibacillus tyrosinisolvens TaxID=1443435 RepID=UPI00069AB847|nr:hypothetical protein [Aneurinibacillus tyrosinisolvens]